MEDVKEDIIESYLEDSKGDVYYQIKTKLEDNILKDEILELIKNADFHSVLDSDFDDCLQGIYRDTGY